MILSSNIDRKCNLPAQVAIICDKASLIRRAGPLAGSYKEPVRPDYTQGRAK